MHEVMHTLGFLHEHQRADRDEHIRIVWENVRNHTNFYDKYDAYGAKTLGTGYDIYSIMHYAPVVSRQQIPD
jgi:astacin